jgi:O-antigen/teichoic acid export membrane protein
MQLSYTKNYLKIYLWQGISLALNFISIFIVIPFLSSDSNVFGIYSVCTSFTIFLNYADFGFLSAGQKFAAESFARKNDNEEIRIIGFTIFILIFFLSIVFFMFLFLSLNPDLIVKDLSNNIQKNIASNLLLILAIFTPTTILQRLLQMIYSIRMEDFIIQRSNVVGNIVKIFSIYLFFHQNNFDIVGYFLFTQFVNLIVALFTLFFASHKYQYNFSYLFKSVRFDKALFKKTNKLAFASLFVTLSWILYYELDSIIIANRFGTREVAVYAIGLTVLSVFRSIFGILFSPFNVRFSHFVAKYDENKLKIFYLDIVAFLAPFVIFPIVSIAILSRPIILTWVGEEYSNSVQIVQFLVLCNVFAFISYPTNFMLVAKERQKELYVISFIVPFIFWGGILLFVGYIGILAFALFKLIAFLFSFLFLYIIMINYLGLSFFESIKKVFLPMVLPLLFLVSVCYIFRDFLPTQMSKSNLVLVISFIILTVCISLLIQYLCTVRWRNKINNILLQINLNNFL